jgi:hypothetical protein
MEYIINENQLRLILSEEENSKLTRNLIEMKLFLNNILFRVKKKYGLNLRMLTTWGAGVGGFVMPLDNFIRTGGFELNDDQIALVLSAIAAFIFYENKTLFRRIYKVIKEENLTHIFDGVISKSIKLKESFFKFMNSLNITFSNMSELIGYSFLIPIITDIQSGISGGNLDEMAINVTKRLIASGVVILSSEVVSSVIKKIIDRIK